MPVDLPESRVLEIWQGCAGRNDLETEEGGAIKVLYRGRLNDGSGADFRDAVIQTGGGLLTGDIEIHTKTSRWWAHGHHLDRLYNRVILHVVLQHDTAKSAKLENGNTAPTLALEKLPASRNKKAPFPAPVTTCRRADKGRGTGSLMAILDEAGEQRFQSRSAAYQAAASPEEAGQALYRGIMTALGYSKNKHPMAELACRMPLRRLESLAAAQIPDAECLALYQARLFGAAGLLPSQRAGHRADNENIVRFNKPESLRPSAGEMAAMHDADWQFFRVRPANYPTRRIAAMCRLLLRYRQDGLLRGLVKKVVAADIEENSRELENALIIEAGDGGDTAGDNGSALLGESRAADIVVNALLPFTAAWGRIISRPELSKKAAYFYLHYPPPASNTLDRHMCRQLNIDAKLINSARRQQGLLHLFKKYCSLGLCRDCPVK
jgi:hypothetical protein